MTANNEVSAQRYLQSALETITIGAMVPDPRTEIIVRHSEEIESLKTKIQEKDEEILRLNKEIKKLRAENEWKGKKIEQLENKIEELEHDKTDLETKLDSVQVELATVRKQVTNLKEENKASREMVDKMSKQITEMKEDKTDLETKLNSVQVEHAAVKKQVTKLKEENKASREEVDKMSRKMEEISIALQINEDENMSLKTEIKNVKETVRNRRTSSLYLPDSTEQATEKASFHLAEMCSRIQAMIYQSVLPDSYDDKSSHKIDHIEEDIENEIKDAEPKEEAKRRWADLKKKLKWDQRLHLRTIKSLKCRRNKTAHPPLNETVLSQSLDVMKKHGELGWRDAPRVEELIQMWKVLKQQQCNRTKV